MDVTEGDKRDAIASVFGRGSPWQRLNRTGAKYGEEDGARTRDIQDHNLALYQLSYILRRDRLST